MVFKTLSQQNHTHEQVVFFYNPETNLRAIVAIHNTILGPSIGGCRMSHYKTEEQALNTVLRLSEAMSYKAALAGLAFGGGKSVIIADPEKHKTPELFKSFGSCINTLNARYIVAKDMGITEEDLQHIGEHTPYVTGRPINKGGKGDPSCFTAKGVYYGIKQAVLWKLKKDSLKGIKIVIQGLGSVGSHLVKFLYQDQADITVYDIKEACIKKIQTQFPKVRACSQEDIFNIDCDVFAPCSIGSVINEKSIQQLKCPIIAGAANNQLSSISIAQQLVKKEMLYVPDFVINSGGLIYAAACYAKTDSLQHIEKQLQQIPHTILQICELSKQSGKDPAQIAIDIAKQKIKKTV